jgi:hypothetical protein
VQDADGHVVTSVTGASTDQVLQVRVADGRLDVVVMGTDPSTGPSTDTHTDVHTGMGEQR